MYCQIDSITIYSFVLLHSLAWAVYAIRNMTAAAVQFSCEMVSLVTSTEGTSLPLQLEELSALMGTCLESGNFPL